MTAVRAVRAPAPLAPSVAAPLRPFVAALNAYTLGSGPARVHRGLPSSTVSVTIPAQDPMEITWVGRPGSRQRIRAAVAGLHLEAAELRPVGCPSGVWLALRPAGVQALLGVPASAVAGQVVELSDVAPALADLQERLAACHSWPQRRTLVERALLAGLARHDRYDRGDDRHGLGHALTALSRTPRVQEAAGVLGYSRRHLNSTVRGGTGVTAKEYQRLTRFETTRGLFVAAARTGAVSLATVAATAGFADQAHLTREWRAMTGCTPTEWLREEGLGLGGAGQCGSPRSDGRGPEEASAACCG